MRAVDLLRQYRQSINLPYTSKDLITIFLTIFLLLIVPVVVISVEQIRDIRSRATIEEEITYDLRSYYPNTDMYGNYYLEGESRLTDPPSRAVLWFEPLDQWSFKMYNSAPEHSTARCHWDLLSWWDDNTFRYSQTHHECPGVIPNDIIYDPPIIFLPRYWDETPWSVSSSSSARYYENGTLTCTGTNEYTGTIIGWEDIGQGEQAIHWRTRQTTTWDDFGKCSGVTEWQEDYWLTDSLPVEGGGTAKGLRQAEGGNLAGGFNWDIWFNLWETLPWVDSQPPSVSLTSPKNGATVSGIVTVEATATDNVGVAMVEFYVDGGKKHTDTSSPYTYSWDTITVSNGTHTLLAKAYDSAGNVGTSSSVSVTVNNTQPQPTADIKANGSDGPITVIYNTAATLSWTSSYATSCTASGGWSGSKGTSGSQSTGNLTSSKTFTLTCTGTGGTAADSATVNACKLGDLNCDGLVNIRDASILVSRWGSNDPIADLNRDGIVNIRDASILVSRWGT